MLRSLTKFPLFFSSFPLSALLRRFLLCQSQKFWGSSRCQVRCYLLWDLCEWFSVSSLHEDKVVLAKSQWWCRTAFSMEAVSFWFDLGITATKSLYAANTPITLLFLVFNNYREKRDERQMKTVHNFPSVFLSHKKKDTVNGTKYEKEEVYQVLHQLSMSPCFPSNQTIDFLYYFICLQHSPVP